MPTRGPSSDLNGLEEPFRGQTREDKSGLSPRFLGVQGLREQRFWIFLVYFCSLL
jgi:hypothetical protein